MNRIILHVDVNNAFLSWTATEMLKKGSKVDIRTRYAIIGENKKERKGIVLAKSNPCKLRGVVTAEPIYSARKKCPYLEVYPPDFCICGYHRSHLLVERVRHLQSGYGGQFYQYHAQDPQQALFPGGFQHRSHDSGYSGLHGSGNRPSGIHPLKVYGGGKEEGRLV